MRDRVEPLEPEDAVPKLPNRFSHLLLSLFEKKFTSLDPITELGRAFDGNKVRVSKLEKETFVASLESLDFVTLCLHTNLTRR